MPKEPPHQSIAAKYPGITIAAAELKVTRQHLHAVLSGKREGKSLKARWNNWLSRNPEFAILQKTKKAS